MEAQRVSRSRYAKRLCSSILAVAMLGSCGMPQETGCIGPPRELGASINQLFTPLLAAAIDHSRKHVDRNDLREIPAPIRERLAPYFSRYELERVRWILASEASGIARLVAGEDTRYEAITLGDLIVFESETASKDAGLWTHELLHVRQYAQAGDSKRFTRNYLSRWPEIERESVAKTNAILEELGISAQQSTPTLARCEASHTGLASEEKRGRIIR